MPSHSNSASSITSYDKSSTTVLAPTSYSGATLPCDLATWHTTGVFKVRNVLSVFIKVLENQFRETHCDEKLSRDSVFAHHISAAHLSQTYFDLLSFLINGDDHLCFLWDQNWNASMPLPLQLSPSVSVTVPICMFIYSCISLTGKIYFDRARAHFRLQKSINLASEKFTTISYRT